MKPHIFSPLFFLRLRKWNLKTCMCSFSSYTFCKFTCLKFMKKHIYIFPFHTYILSLPLFPQCTCCTLMQWNCALSFLFLFTYFLSHRMWFISGHKNKGSCWCSFILFFSCNQLTSETHSFWLWPHSHWNQ